MAQAGGVVLRTHVIVGHEVKIIVEFATEHRFDLLVIGFMGHSALYNRVMGGDVSKPGAVGPLLGVGGEIRFVQMPRRVFPWGGDHASAVVAPSLGPPS